MGTLEEAIAREGQVLALLETSGSMSRISIETQLGMEPVKALMALFRLAREGKVQKRTADDGRIIWAIKS